jgi:uncharacterized protein YycO
MEFINKKLGKRMKVVISQPMKGKTKEEILEERKRILEIAKIKGNEVIETMHEDYKDEGNKSIKCLSKSIEAIGDADMCKILKNTSIGIAYDGNIGFSVSVSL